MVQYDEDDELFTSKGQHGADRKIAEIYTKMKSRNNYVGKFYPGLHKFDVAMQEEAFQWVERVLRKIVLAAVGLTRLKRSAAL